jgi:hypothetical protein
MGRNAPEKNQIMNRYKAVATMFAVSLAVFALSPNVEADEWNRKTKVTFSAPVEIPGVGAQVLPAGTYTFKIMDSLSDRHIVQVLSEDETHVYSTILAIPNYRLRSTDKTVMTFAERAAGEPQAIRAWFYPGRHWGEEFVYPKSRAMVLAKLANAPVLATPIELETAPVEALKAAPVVAVTPAGEEVPVAQVVEAPPAEATDVVARRLPETAGPLPLLGLLGLLSMGAGLALSVISKRKS